jgi:hypothetical protein
MAKVFGVLWEVFKQSARNRIERSGGAVQQGFAAVDAPPAGARPNQETGAIKKSSAGQRSTRTLTLNWSLTAIVVLLTYRPRRVDIEIVCRICNRTPTTSSLNVKAGIC